MSQLLQPSPKQEKEGEGLAALPLFRGLEEARIARLLADARMLSCEDGTMLFEEGQAPDRLFVLLGGIVELFTTGSGREAAVMMLWPPETFLPAAAITSTPYLLSARTLGSARLLALDARRMRSEVRDCPALAGRIARLLSGHFRMAVRNVKNLKLRKAPERVGAFLLRLIDETGRHGCADLPIPKSKLASRIGISPESLSRAFHVLRDHGLEVRGSRLILTDRAVLERFCEPDPLMDGLETELWVTAM